MITSILSSSLGLCLVESSAATCAGIVKLWILVLDSPLSSLPTGGRPVHAFSVAVHAFSVGGDVPPFGLTLSQTSAYHPQSCQLIHDFHRRLKDAFHARAAVSDCFSPFAVDDIGPAGYF
jgi:hypothetical protein